MLGRGDEVEGLLGPHTAHHATDVGHGGPAPTSSVFPTKARGCWPIFDRPKRYPLSIPKDAVARNINQTSLSLWAGAPRSGSAGSS